MSWILPTHSELNYRVVARRTVVRASPLERQVFAKTRKQKKSEYYRRWYLRKGKEYHRQYNKTAKRLEWLDANKPKLRAYGRDWQKKNKDKRNEYWREHYLRNREKRRAYLNAKQREYRARSA
jgi:hypothetical protein